MNKVLNIKGAMYRVLFSAEEIQAKIRDLAERLKADYGSADKPPILLIVLTGGLYFGIDLSKQLDEIGLRHHVDTVGLKRYSNDEQGGAVELLSKPHANLAARDVIVVEDVIDNGATMNFLHEYLKKFIAPPRTIKYCVLGLKINHGPLKFSVDYPGFSLDKNWIVGYGLDTDRRNL